MNKNEMWNDDKGNIRYCHMGDPRDTMEHHHNIYFASALREYSFERSKGSQMYMIDCKLSCPSAQICKYATTSEDIYLAAYLSTIREKSQWEQIAKSISNRGNAAINDLFRQGKEIVFSFWRLQGSPDPSVKVGKSKLTGWPPAKGTGTRSLLKNQKK
ncbi:hypothetical protein V5F53_02685 [Xanthobacter sp. V4C-4]|uniref:hypothetical protein n=1 Tax=Xanthobacter cornucopiae TaxID=3119924 RepID=UPI0037273A6D